jgi:hypothetical protein
MVCPNKETSMSYSHRRRVSLWCAFILFCPAGLLTSPEASNGDQKKSGPVPVRLVKTGEGYQLLRGGKPFFVKGAGGAGSRKGLAAAGANSVRTWNSDRLGPLLDEAHRLGLTVAVGIWLGHERHGFNYNNADQVADQYAKARAVILRYKDHPAVLLWGIGNEMEGFGNADNAAVWSAVNNIASMAKKLDPNHPTMTVVAELGGDRVKNINRLCPDIDIVGINSYARAATLAQRYRAAGGTRPYLLTEFGPPGWWEVKKSAWGAPVEPTSTQKGESYRKTYEQAVLKAGGLCLGSYTFLWGHKQEATATWFGMLLPDGSRVAAADVMQELWSGKPPANRCPVIEELKVVGPSEVGPGATVRASLRASDPEGDPLTVRWVLQGEPFVLGEGGDEEEAPPTYPEALVRGTRKEAELRMPKGGGGYRLFAYVRDGKGGAAVANVPLRVTGPVVLPKARRASLPFVVYDEATRDRPPYAPTGWMGNTKATKLDLACAARPRSGKTCIRIDYRDKDGWAGIVWQSPANDWGNRPGGWDLSGAKKLTFWARGERGTEVVTFEFGLIGRDKRFHDTARGKLDKVKLTREWRQYTMDLAGKDLTRVKSAFACVWSGQGGPLTFYLDDIRYE